MVIRTLNGKPDHQDGVLLHPLHDVPATEVINPDSDHPILLVCEHAGRHVPNSLELLGLSLDAYDLHISHDIGAENVSRRLAADLGSALVLQRYSRLVIDCNRPLGTETSIPEISDEIAVPGNIGLSAPDRRLREDLIFAPFAASCLHHIAQPHIAAAFSIHSFTPVLARQRRPWGIGFLYRSKVSRGQELADLCARLWPDLVVGYNDPYGIDGDADWFVPACAEPRNIPHCLLEIRNDLISSEAGCANWAARLHQLFTAFMEDTK
ncbi:MAG: N-formylglutamate amidohydrolase [Rhodobacteraceae bacterium]|nr:N-formylglutamate amidohydrolase [Paracoccaceae bacterium]